MKVFLQASMISLAICAGTSARVAVGVPAADNDVGQASDPPASPTTPKATPAKPAEPTAGEQPRRMTQQDRARLQKMKHLPQPAVATTEPQTWAESTPLPDHIRSFVLADAAKRTGTRSGDPAIIESVAITWPDGSLGCPERNMYYPQLPTAGYRVVVLGDGRTYDYRVALPPGAASRATATDGAHPAPTDQTAPIESLQIRLCDPTHALDPLQSN